MYKWLVKMALRIIIKLHNVCYRAISKLVVLENDGLHPKHKILNYHQFFLDNIENGDTVLDIGCGNGAVAYDLAGKARKVVGIDQKEKGIEYAFKNYKKPNLSFIHGDALGFSFDGKFDKVILSNVLEHIDQRAEFLARLSKLTSVILLRVPLVERDWLAVYKKQSKYEYRLDPTHFIEYTIAGLEEELRQGGWKIFNFQIKYGEFWGVLHSFKQYEKN